MHYKEILDLYDEFKNDFESEIKEEYEKYISTISSRGMAASLECCIFLMTMCKKIKPKYILDLGSGFSSYSLRYYIQSNKSDTIIWSVDSNNQWLEKSKEFCKDKVDTSNFFTWDQISNKKQIFDIIFIDIDRTIKRPKYFEPIFNNFTGPNTVILVDDYHKGLLRKVLPPLIEKYNFEKYELRQTQNKKRYQLILKNKR